MYCKVCTQHLSYGDELKDERGSTHSHTLQICNKCRPAERMAEKDIRLFLNDLKEKADVAKRSKT